MQLAFYDITITLSDPEDPETQIKCKLSKVPREKVISAPMPLKNLLETFESAVDEV
jgi:hypothetical protein